MSSENLELAKSVVKSIIGVLTVFATLYGVNNLIEKVDDLRINQHGMQMQMIYMQDQLDKINKINDKHWQALKEIHSKTRQMK